MKRRRRLIIVAGVLVAISVTNLIIIQAIGAGDAQPLIIRVWNAFLTGLLALFLVLGKNSARWITVFLCGLGSLGGFIGITAILVMGGIDAPYANLFLSWLAVVTVVYGFISGYLAYSSGVAREIRRIAEHIG
jgi:peptidoglycan/LPS O-acetylase OafA/YrhL